MDSIQLYIENNLDNDVATIDSEDQEKCFRYKWRIHKRHGIKYLRAEIGSRHKFLKRERIYLHHVIMGKPPVGKEIDHIDGNGLNNKKNNLRVVDHKTNMNNRKERRQAPRR